MSFPRYERYKESGVEWLGEVPEEWTVKRLKYLCNVQTGDKDTVNAVEDGEYPFFVRSQTVEHINSFAFDCEAVLTAGDGVGVGKVFHHYSGKFDFHQRVYMMNNFRFVTGKFFFRYLASMFHKVALEGGTKSTVDSLRMPLFLNFEFAIPSSSEQHTIVAFLDSETTKIDDLVAEQERLIALLKEKRQATISHAVTKGLNPDAPMKDSGIEWLGAVPVGWEVLRFTRVIRKIEQGWSPNASSDPCDLDSWGVLKLSAIKNGTFIPSENKMLLEETNPDLSIEVKAGDFLVTRANTPELVGDACVVSEFNGYRLMLSDLIYRIHLNAGHEPRYFCRLLVSRYGRAQIETDARGSSMSMAKISQGHICSWMIPVPPLQEQSAIVAFLDSETAKIDALVGEAQQAIGLFKERRIALISAAVTGKIDVRNAC